MAESKEVKAESEIVSKDGKFLTWQEKLEKGIPLNELEETKADADFNYLQRLRENKERQAFEQRKNIARTSGNKENN